MVRLQEDGGGANLTPNTFYLSLSYAHTHHNNLYTLEYHICTHLVRCDARSLPNSTGSSILMRDHAWEPRLGSSLPHRDYIYIYIYIFILTSIYIIVVFVGKSIQHKDVVYRCDARMKYF
jgi:hypothetical protein